MNKICVIGAGSWGTALASVLLDNGHAVTIWSIDPKEVEMLQTHREQREKLPGVILDARVKVTADLERAVQGQDILLMAVPSPYTRTTARAMQPFLCDGQLVLDVAKGIEEGTLMTLSRQIEEELPTAEVAVLSGPSHAEEVGRKLPTAVVVGAKDMETARFLQEVFMNDYFRVYTSDDVVGMEVGGALKNVIALAAGIADGLGAGDNTKAALITRGIKEIAMIGEKMGGRRETFYGLTGIGDLIVTCASQHSRNRKAGYLIGQGLGMQEAMAEVQMVVEGVYSAKAAIRLAEQYALDTPILREVSEVLFDGKPAKEAVTNLMLRDGKTEFPLS